MAIIVDYGTLKTAVADWLARSDLTTFVANFVQNAENRIYRELRVRHMRQASTIAIALGDTNFSTETGYLETYAMQVVGSPNTIMRKVSIENSVGLSPRGGTAGKPAYFIPASSSSITFYPTADAAYTITHSYYRREAAMTNSTDAPWIVTDCPDLTLFAALVSSASFIKDDARIATWEQQYQTAKDALMLEGRRERASGSKQSALSRY